MNGMSTSKYIPSSPICTDPFSSKYAVQEDIGRGKFAVVRRCVCLETGEVVAAKVIRKRRKGKSCREEILREVVMLELAMAHPRLVSLREVFETPTELILVTEYCSGGELFDECVIKESFKEDDVRKLLAQILEGLAYLHDNNIVHLDLKPQNILLTKPFPEGDIKICDLGFACLTNTGEDIRDIIGTPDYVAPEVLDYEPLNIQTDMWSLGVLTYVMLTACSPFVGDTQQETFCNITQIKMDYPDELFADINPLAKDFISKLLVKRPRDRMTAKQCLDHPWLVDLKDTMVIQVPTPDHSEELAHDMIVPSNWHMTPDRKRSVPSIEAALPDTVIPVANGRSLSESSLNQNSAAENKSEHVAGEGVRTSTSEEKDLISSTLSHIDIDRSNCTSFETCPEASDTSPTDSTTSLTSNSHTQDNSSSMTVFASEVANSALTQACTAQPPASLPFPPEGHSLSAAAARDRLSSDSFRSCSLSDSPVGQPAEPSTPSEFPLTSAVPIHRDTNKMEHAWKRMSTEIPPKKAKCIEGEDEVVSVSSSSYCEESQPPGEPAVASSTTSNGMPDMRNAV